MLLATMATGDQDLVHQTDTIATEDAHLPPMPDPIPPTFRSVAMSFPMVLAGNHPEALGRC